MKIDAQVTFEKVNFSQEKDAHLVLSVTAPSHPGIEKRPDICIGLCIDVSGSMKGAKLDFAKKSALKVVEHLRPGDYCGVIAFESSIHVSMAPVRITPESKEQLKTAINKLRTMGGTNFSGGMLKMLELMKNLDLPSDVLHRVVMLTDGQANEGVATKPEDIVKVLAANSGRITASAFGFGTDISQDFLTAFARAGKGNYAYIEEPDSALTAFGNELGGLLSTYATDLTIEVTSLANHCLEEVISDVPFSKEEIGNTFTLTVPNILAEETRHFVFRVKLGEQKQTFPRPVNVFEATMAYDIIASDGRKERQTVENKAKVTFVRPGDEQTKPSAALDGIVGLAQIVRAQIQAEEKAKKGDYSGAAQLMSLMEEDVTTRGHVQLANGARNIRRRMVSPEAYHEGSTYLNAYRVGATRGTSCTTSNLQARADLVEVGVSFDNSSMRDMVEDFTGQPGVPLGRLTTLQGMPAVQPPVDLNSLLTDSSLDSPPAIDMDGTIARMAYRK